MPKHPRTKTPPHARTPPASKCPHAESPTVGTTDRFPTNDSHTVTATNRFPTDDSRTVDTTNRFPTDDSRTADAANPFPTDDSRTADATPHSPTDTPSREALNGDAIDCCFPPDTPIFVWVKTYHFDGTRAMNRQFAARAALQLAQTALESPASLGAPFPAPV